jgi:hypothetical protein
MKKATKFTIYLAMWIVLIFGIGIVMTFVNDAIQLTGFFGDTPCTEKFGGCGIIDSEHSWGARHYWYFWGCVLLFMLTVARCVLWCVYYWDRKIFDKL